MRFFTNIDYFQVHEAAKVMWFEKVCLWVQLFEKNVVYPMIFLSALTVDVETIQR